jgi:hypothetical protein
MEDGFSSMVMKVTESHFKNISQGITSTAQALGRQHLLIHPHEVNQRKK